MSRIDFARSGSIPPASSKIANEARSGAIARIGGLLNLPGIGGRHRDELGLELHAKARRRIVSPPTGETRKVAIGRVPLVDERAGDRARTGVEIFVGTPDREIDIPIVQRERNVAGRMREIDPDDATALLRSRGDSRDVEELAGEKIHPGEKDERDLVAVFFEQRFDVFRSNRVFAFARPREQERLVGSKP